MKIHECWLQTANYDELRAWYRERGFTVVAAKDDGFAIEAGWSRLIFRAAPDKKAPVYHFAFNIPPNRLDAALAWAKANTTVLPHADKEIIQHDNKVWQAAALYFLDAGGNIVELIARDRLANSKKKSAFSVDEILCLSEIGLVGDPMPPVAHWVGDTVGLPLFSGDPTGEFAAFGNDDGLLILSKQGRPWLPTKSPATVESVNLVIEGPAVAECFLAGYPYQISVQAPEPAAS